MLIMVSKSTIKSKKTREKREKKKKGLSDKIIDICALTNKARCDICGA